MSVSASEIHKFKGYNSLDKSGQDVLLANIDPSLLRQRRVVLACLQAPVNGVDLSRIQIDLDCSSDRFVHIRNDDVTGAQDEEVVRGHCGGYDRDNLSVEGLLSDLVTWNGANFAATSKPVQALKAFKLIVM